jgi:hypothetical protein
VAERLNSLLAPLLPLHDKISMGGAPLALY